MDNFDEMQHIVTEDLPRDGEKYPIPIDGTEKKRTGSDPESH